MRRLNFDRTTRDRAEVAALLESRGIPVYVDWSWRGRNPSRGAILVCIDAQYDDAVALLADAEHDVAEPVDVAAFWKKAPGTLSTILNYALVILALLIGLWILLAAGGFTSR
jgi:hypothetical protein